RWLGSNFAYQVYPHIFPHNIDKNYQFFNCLNKQFIKPDMTVYLKIEPQLGLERKQNQKDHKLDVIECKSLTYFEIVREGYYRYLTHHQCGIKLILNGKANIATNIRTIMKYLGEIQNGNHN
uniref:dTMP kinase n=1 Tax=Poinsettia branch-inducing phytoplasma TaxID=138647 RepID=UPI000366240E